MTRYLLLWLIIISMLMSCNSGIAIIASNQSSADRQVEVTLPTSVNLPGSVNSIQAWDLTHTQNEIAIRDKYRYSLTIPVAVDTTRNVLSFNLKSHHKATVLGYTTSLKEIRNTLFVVGTDTLKYKRKGGCWIFTIK